MNNPFGIGNLFGDALGNWSYPSYTQPYPREWEQSYENALRAGQQYVPDRCIHHACPVCKAVAEKEEKRLKEKEVAYKQRLKKWITYFRTNGKEA